MITGLYAGIAALLLVYLSARVIGYRRRNKISVGTAGNEGLERAMRVQGNFTEYAPVVLLLMALAEFNGLPAWGVHTAGILLIASRLMHFVGFASNSGPVIMRIIGMLITFVLLVVLGLVCAVQFVHAPTIVG